MNIVVCYDLCSKVSATLEVLLALFLPYGTMFCMKSILKIRKLLRPAREDIFHTASLRDLRVVCHSRFLYFHYSFYTRTLIS